MTVSGHGHIQFSPLGPHFYIKSESSQHAPPDDADWATNVMNEHLTELNEDHGWPITHEHIKAHVPIAPVSWDGEDEYHVEYEMEPLEVSLDWYSRSPLWEWEDI